MRGSIGALACVHRHECIGINTLACWGSEEEVRYMSL